MAVGFPQIDWIAFGFFLILSVAAVLCETMWLVRRNWTTSGKAIAYVLLTDILGIGVGLFTLFAAVSVMIMMAFGSSGGGGTAPESAYFAVLSFGLLFPPLFLLSLKRLFLLILGIRTARSAWLYSLASTASIIVGVFVVPIVVFRILHRI
jgi:hypothetical protein